MSECVVVRRRAPQVLDIKGATPFKNTDNATVALGQAALERRQAIVERLEGRLAGCARPPERGDGRGPRHQA
jgi:hypothetical protein